MKLNTQHPHRRFNALTGDWILVSPHRTQRPWQGQQEQASTDTRPEYDPACYLCPGNARAGGLMNETYTSTFVFKNDFAALMAVEGEADTTNDVLFQSAPVKGECRVICFSPRHDLTLPEMNESDIRRVVDVWSAQMEELSKTYMWMQIFENKGAAMGCSNPHPHGQIWASNSIPNEPSKEDRQQIAYFERHQKPLLMDYLNQELAHKARLVVENDHWVAVVPYWAVWPYETLLLPRRHVQQITELTDAERTCLASIMKRLLTRYDNLFQTSFPYSMGWHGAPFNGKSNRHWQLHAHFYPPLLRSSTVKKFMVGYEMMAEAQRDLTAEQAAERLRGMSDVHFKHI